MKAATGTCRHSIRPDRTSNSASRIDEQVQARGGGGIGNGGRTGQSFRPGSGRRGAASGAGRASAARRRHACRLPGPGARCYTGQCAPPRLPSLRINSQPDPVRAGHAAAPHP